MIYPPIFAVCAADLGVQSKLGINPTRLYPFGEAPSLSTKAYAVWQIIGGTPENYLACPPDIDFFSIQVDVYGKTAQEVREAADALRVPIEAAAYIVAWRIENREIDTQLYRLGFDVSWKVQR